MPLTIQELIDEAHATAIEHGWWEKQCNFPEQLMLMVQELSEAMDDYRNTGLDTLFQVNYDSPPHTDKPVGIATELADTIIRIANISGHFGIPLEEALRAKLAYNKTRPYKHGGKLC